MSDSQEKLPQLQGSMALDKFMKWEDMALSSLMAVLVKIFDCDNFKLELISRPSVETRLWFVLRFQLPEWYGHESKRTRIISGSSLEIMKTRLIKCLDREKLCKTRLERIDIKHDPDEEDEQEG